MKLIKTPVQQIEIFKSLYESAFPSSEKKPFALMEEKCGENMVDFLSIVDDGDNFFGLMITLKNRDLVLLDYFAISENFRGCGIGSKALELYCDYYAGKKIFLEIEAPDQSAANAYDRLRRKNFYFKNGFSDICVNLNIYGVDMQLLAYSTSLTYDEYVLFMRESMGESVLSIINPTPLPLYR